MLIQTPAWRVVDCSFVGTLSRCIAGIEARHPGSIPDLHSASRLFIASDYGGEHQTARYQTMSFLVSDIADCAAWMPYRNQVRSKLLPEKRRLGFKVLNDRVRSRAIGEFLEVANGLHGLLATFAIHKKVQSLFQEKGKLDVSTLGYEPLRQLSAAIAEKMLRVTSMVSLLLAGLSAPMQDVLWVTDNDDIVANDKRLRLLINTLANVSSNCLPHTLGHLRVGTAQLDDGDLFLEDLLSIPDIAAGALAHVLQSTFGDRGAPNALLHMPRINSLPPKVSKVMDWFADNTQNLRRIVILIDEESTSGRLRATHFWFHGSRDAIFEP